MSWVPVMVDGDFGGDQWINRGEIERVGGVENSLVLPATKEITETAADHFSDAVLEFIGKCEAGFFFELLQAPPELLVGFFPSAGGEGIRAGSLEGIRQSDFIDQNRGIVESAEDVNPDR